MFHSPPPHPLPPSKSLPLSFQIIRCQQLAAGEAALHEWLATFQPATASRLTLRCCAILDGPPVPGEQQSLVAVLPASEPAGGGDVAGTSRSGASGGSGSGGSPAVVRALALCGSTAVCPQGKYVLYLWADGGDCSGSGDSADPQGATAAAALWPALGALANASGLQGPAASTPPQPPAAEPGSSEGEGGSGSGKPTVLWAAFYMQRSTHLLDEQAAAPPGSGRWPANVALCPGPDCSVTFVSAVEAAKACYWRLFPPVAGADAAPEAGAAAAEAPGEAAATAAGGQQRAAPPLFPLDPQARRPQSAGEDGDVDGAAAAAAGAPDADSDDEALAALQAALRHVGGGSTGAAAAADGAAVEEAAGGAGAPEGRG